MINHVGKMTVAAHRGDCYNFFENTMTAFRAAINEKADMIELDVHMTSDGHLVVMHDATVDRTTDGTGKISEKTLDEMLSLNAGNSVTPEKVPTFEEFMVFAKSANTMLNIEIKEYYSAGLIYGVSEKYLLRTSGDHSASGELVAAVLSNADLSKEEVEMK